MADQSQEIALKFSAQTQAVDAAERKSQALRQRLEELQSTVRAGGSGWEKAQQEIAGVTRELAAAEAQAKQTHASMSAPPVAPRLDAGRQSQLAFGLANLAQDAYYSPGAAVNNAMFLAQMSGGPKQLALDLKDLAVVGARTAGGWLKAVPGLFTTLATAAAGGSAAVIAGGVAMVGAAVGGVALHKGLKDAGLGWSDLGSVLSNTTLVQGAADTMEGFGNVVAETWDALGDTAVGSAVDGVWDGLKSVVHETANLTLGWDQATEAAKRHKEITEEGAKAAAEWAKKVAEAEAGLRGVKSEEQKRVAEAGAALVQGLADEGGKAGLEGSIKRIAGLGLFDENGAAVDAERLRVELNAARGGDESAMGRVRNWSRMAGLDPDRAARDAETDMLNAEGRKNEQAWRDEQAKQEAEDAKRAAQALAEEDAQRRRNAEAESRERERRMADAPGAARRTIGALDERVQQALVLGRVGGGSEAAVGEAVGRSVAAALEAKGMGKDEAGAAANAIVEEQQARIRDGVAMLAMRGGEAGAGAGFGFGQSPRTIAAADFARNVQDGQDTQREIRDINKQMLEKLAAIENRGLAGRLGR